MKKTLLVHVFAAIAVTLLKQSTPCQAAPRKAINTYDQRQDGKFNVHAKLENSLFVFVPSSSSGTTDLASLLQNDLVAQVLELKNVAPRVKNHHEATEIVAKPEDASGVDVENSGVKIANPEIEAAKPEDNKDGGLSVKLIAIVQRDLSDVAPVAQSSTTNLKNEKNFKKYFDKHDGGIEAAVAGKHAEKDGKILAKNPTESGTDAYVGENSGKPTDNGPGELRLIGDGIENCGPERCRNSLGICEFCNKE